MSVDTSDTVEQLSAQVNELTRKVRDMEDRIAIRELTARYNHAFDDVDTEAFVNTFTEDGVFQLDTDGLVTAGRERLAAMSQVVNHGPVHMTTDPVIEIDGDRATQVCSLALGGRTREREPGSATYLTSGRYYDELVRTPEGWLFSKRLWVPDAFLELPEW
jgi:ketosteroid isomerase-like protein